MVHVSPFLWHTGNALLKYKDTKGNYASKIIHVHENELTFEANYYEDLIHSKVVLKEEDLLSKEKAPLIISSEQVKPFAVDKSSRKINDHTYKIDLDIGLLASRNYLELTHHDEPIFVGYRSKNQVAVPAENFMRHVLTRFPQQKLGNRCLVQINLSKKVERVDVGTESVASSLETYTQVLDRDGRFYDSASDKTEKVIIVGENTGSEDIAQDGKVNIKITYQDESVHYMSSYCSPNTYLVEQL